MPPLAPATTFCGVSLQRSVLISCVLALIGLGLSSPAQAQPVQRADTVNGVQLIAALNTIPSEAQTLENTEVDEVHVVSVQKIRKDLSENGSETLDEALRTAQTKGLYEALRKKEAVVRAIEERADEASVEDVVAIDVYQEEGTVVVYYKPEA